MADIYAEIAVKIIESQEAIIGPVAVEQAQQVSGMTIDWAKQDISISGDKIAAIENLINKYKELFGQISVEVSQQAAASLMAKLPANGVPEMLK